MSQSATSDQEQRALPRIAVFSGPTATIMNTPPLLTAERAGTSEQVADADSADSRPVPAVDALRPQRLATAVKVYVERFSAHPLEADAAELYGPPDGFVDAAGTFHKAATSASDIAVYEIELDPSDGLYLLPYVARDRCGAPWKHAHSDSDAIAGPPRQTFLPDASRVYEEIDRFGLGPDGSSNLLSRHAEFDFFRTVPSAGWTHGGVGRGVDREVAGVDFFAYAPLSLRGEPPRGLLARVVNEVQRVLRTGMYAGAQWLEGSPTVDETLYWIGLLVDTELPIVGHSAQRAHQSLSADGPKNIVDGVRYIVSRAWADKTGADEVGPVLVVDELAYAARDVTKVDARPGGYVTTGGHGGIVADLGGAGAPRVTYVPRRRFSHGSALRLSALPREVFGVKREDGVVRSIPVAIKDDAGQLRGDAIPKVTIETYVRYGADSPGESPEQEPGIVAWIEHHLSANPLAGFVIAGSSPYGNTTPPAEAALRMAVMSGFPVVACGRANPGGRAYGSRPHLIAGDNLTPVKARLLLMAALMKLGAMPPARDPRCPTAAEMERTLARVAQYESLFASH